MGYQEEDIFKDIKEKNGLICLKGINDKRNMINTNAYNSSSSHYGMNSSPYNTLNSSQIHHQCNYFTCSNNS